MGGPAVGRRPVEAPQPSCGRSTNLTRVIDFVSCRSSTGTIKSVGGRQSSKLPIGAKSSASRSTLRVLRRRDRMPRNRPPKPKSVLLADRIAEARLIVDAQPILLENLRVAGAPTHKAEGVLRTYASSLMHLLAYERRKKAKPNSKAGTKSVTNRRQPKATPSRYRTARHTISGKFTCAA
jgi:hypothetical protein